MTHHLRDFLLLLQLTLFYIYWAGILNSLPSPFLLNLFWPPLKAREEEKKHSEREEGKIFKGTKATTTNDERGEGKVWLLTPK